MYTWEIDAAHSSVEFKVKHMMLSFVRGNLSGIKGEIKFDESSAADSSVSVELDANTISTNNEGRDGHLKSADFFDTEKFPTISFESSKVSINSNNTGTITGMLTIKDVSKEIEIDVEFNGIGNTPDMGYGVSTVAGFVGTTKINREDFGLTWNAALETGGVLVGKEIELTLDIQAKKVSAN